MAVRVSETLPCRERERVCDLGVSETCTPHSLGAGMETPPGDPDDQRGSYPGHSP